MRQDIFTQVARYLAGTFTDPKRGDAVVDIACETAAVLASLLAGLWYCLSGFLLVLVVGYGLAVALLVGLVLGTFERRPAASGPVVLVFPARAGRRAA